MKTVKQKLKDDLRLILMVAALALLMGSMFTVGAKTVDKYWPDTPTKIEYTIKGINASTGGHDA